LSLTGNDDLRTDATYLKARIPTTAHKKIIVAVIVTTPMPGVDLGTREEELGSGAAGSVVWMTKVSLPRIDYA